MSKLIPSFDDLKQHIRREEPVLSYEVLVKWCGCYPEYTGPSLTPAGTDLWTVAASSLGCELNSQLLPLRAVLHPLDFP